jgi:iron complex outermembrane recepter protein
MKNRTFSEKSRLVLLSGAGVAALWGGAAQAQTISTEVVTVTGSRIPHVELDTPSPVVSVTAQDIQNSGTLNLTDYLHRIPSLVGSMGDFDTNGFASPAAADGSSLGGLNLLDLRNLGYVRTLVLIDGHRTVAESTGSAAVDTNTIPITLIDRVDVDTEGDSAVYGADGVSGVVNFIMKHNLEGVRARFQAGTPEDGGASKYLTSISAGHNFDDGKGNITLTYEGSYQDRLFFTQRSFTKEGGRTFFVANPAEVASGIDDPNVPDFIPTKDVAYLSSAKTGAIDLDGDGLPDVLGNGQPFNLGQSVGNFSAIGSSGMPYADDVQGDFEPIERRNIAQISGHYDFADWFKLSAEFKFAGVQTKSTSSAPFDDYAIITADNAFLPPALAATIAALPDRPDVGLGAGQALLAEDYLAIRNQEEVKRQTYRSVIGATGDLVDNDWISNLRYDLSYTYGQTDIDDIFENDRVTDRFFAALDSVKDGSGNAVCRSNLDPSAVPPDLSGVFGVDVFSDTAPNFESSRFGESFTPGPNSGCVAFNPFGPDAASQAARNFVTQRVHTLGVLTQNDVNGYLSADFKQFQDAGWLEGPLSVVLGGEYRKETSKSTIDPRFDPTNLYAAVSNGVAGEFDVYEFYAEADIPILKDKMWAKELTINLAGRQSHYSTAGDSSTWKISAVWAPTEKVKFRGTEGYAVRAPNIGELYAPQQLGFADIDDPCDRLNVNNGTQYRVANCTALEQQLGVAYTPGVTNLATGSDTEEFTGGNPALKPESARTITGGVVVTPTDKLVLTADWYNVSISQAISPLSAGTIAEQCVDLPTIVDNPYCAAAVRYGVGGVYPGSLFTVSAQQINVAAKTTSGLDYSVNYHTQIADVLGDDYDYGEVNFKLIGNYLDKLSFTPLAGQPSVETAGTVGGGEDGGNAPKWSNNLDITWISGDWSVDYNIDWYAAMWRGTLVEVAAQPDLYANQYKKTSQRFENDVQVGYDIDNGMQLYAGVNNLFYQKPALGEANTPIAAIGRFFYVGVNANLDYDRLGL